MAKHIKENHVELYRSPPYPFAQSWLVERKSAMSLIDCTAHFGVNDAGFASSTIPPTHGNRLKLSSLLTGFLSRSSALLDSEAKPDPTSIGVCLWANLVRVGEFYQLPAPYKSHCKAVG